MNKKYVILGTCAAVVLAAFIFLQSERPKDVEPTPPFNTAALAGNSMPELEGNAVVGRSVFEKSCSACHGAQGGGNPEAGPPLIHKIYEPSHHGDESFQRAVANGVRAHHWQFGDMSPIEGLTRGNVAMVVEYIRAVQRANGIN